jgi:hypothetical protein
VAEDGDSAHAQHLRQLLEKADFTERRAFLAVIHRGIEVNGR